MKHCTDDLDIKFNNCCSRVSCVGCGCSLWPEIGHQITLRKGYYFVCDGCVREKPNGLILISARNELNKYFCYETEENDATVLSPEDEE